MRIRSLTKHSSYKHFDKFTEKYNVRTYELFNSWVKAFMDIYRTYDRAVENPHIAIVDFFGGDISVNLPHFKRHLRTAV